MSVAWQEAGHYDILRKLPLGSPPHRDQGRMGANGHYRKEGAMHRFLGFLLLMLTGLAMPAMADQWTDSELRAMPPYCAARLHKNPAQEDQWRAALGPDYQHTHHFCAAIGFINRYYAARTTRSKAFNLQNAMGNLNYMIAHASPGYSLMPEVYLNRGLVQTQMKKDGAALMDILKAIELDPKLVRAYSMAAEHYVKLNKKNEALKFATEGLRYNPESTVLQRLYLKLGGQLPYPEPVALQEPDPSMAPTESNTTGATPNSATESGAAEQAPPATTAPGSATPDSGHAATDPETPRIGSPSNPWCRFCPPEPDK